MGGEDACRAFLPGWRIHATTIKITTDGAGRGSRHHRGHGTSGAIPPSPPSRRPHPSHRHQPPRPHDRTPPSMRRVSASRRLAICIRRPDLRKAEILRVISHTRHTRHSSAAPTTPSSWTRARHHPIRPAGPASPPEGTPPPWGDVPRRPRLRPRSAIRQQLIQHNPPYACARPGSPGVIRLSR
jgi:hypothetical protein